MTWELRPVVRRGTPLEDALAIEEPLELRVEGEPLVVTLRTPGHDLEWARGFLSSEGLIEDEDDLTALAHVSPNVVDCRLASGVHAHQEALRKAARATLTTAACGLCGKTTLDAVRVRASRDLGEVHLDLDALSTLPDRLQALQEGFVRTGGLHGAGLLDREGGLLVVREDIGRHNAVDKVLGWALARGHPAAGLVVSSRAGFEIVQKARVAGIRTVIAMGAASTLAADLARQEGMTLLGFFRRDGATRYC